MADTSTLRDVLAQRHPIYSASATDWQFFLDSYVGGSQYGAGNYLYKHARESTTQFEDRQKRAVFNNYCRKVVDIYKAFLYAQPILRKTDDATFRSVLSDADLRGHDLDHVMAEDVARQAFALGHVVVVVDMNNRDATPITKRDERERNVRPYLVVYTPIDVADWGTDSEGRYTWLRLIEPAPDTSSPFTKRPDQKTYYRTWTPDEWRLHDEDGVLIDSGGNPLGRVPAERIAPIDHPMYTDVGQSLITDIAPLNRAIYNYRSLLEEFLALQCFNILGIPVPEDPQTADKVNQLMKTLGTRTGIYYDPKGGAPAYISPPVDPAEFLMRVIESSTREIIDLAKLQDRSAQAKQESGVSRAYEFLESNSTFASIARNLEDGEKRIMRLVAQWSNVNASMDDLPIEVEYPDSFDVQTLGDEIEEALGLIQLSISDTFNKELKKRIAKKALPDATDETEEQIAEEIDAGTSDDALRSEVQRQLAAMRSEQDDDEPDETPPPSDGNATREPPEQERT